MTLYLGCIADDFTGATDLANILVGEGMRTTLCVGVPEREVPESEAVVVALKSRTVPAEEAVEESLKALAWLREVRAQQFFFKYCSTFDSTDEGNIGPVAEALLEELGGELAIACPAFPENGRSVYKGYLFVGDVLFSESGMQHHPLTPMRDANLVRVLDRQTKRDVGLVDYGVVEEGVEAIGERMKALVAEGKRLAIVDALRDEHLRAIGKACAGHELVTGGSGVALGLPANFVGERSEEEKREAVALPEAGGYAAVLAGSCSQATLGQIAYFAELGTVLRVDPRALAEGESVVEEALAWARGKLDGGPVLIASSAAPEELERVQGELGRERAGALVEEAMAGLAKGLVEMGVRRLVVAGGETAGAAVQALGVEALRIGPQIDPGVPWCLSLDERGLFLALKSGNFGGEDFMTKAFEVLR